MEPPHKPLGQRQYKDLRVCPVCRSEDIDIREVFPELGSMEEQRVCRACRQIWYEVYLYHHYVLEGKDPLPEPYP